MSFISFHTKTRPSFGFLKENGVVELRGRFGELHSLRDLLEADLLGVAADRAAGLSPDIGLADITYLPTIPNAEKYICIGVNYGNRNAEYNDQSPSPKYPSVFMRSADSFVGHNSPLVRPPESHELDYEGEIAIVIGKEGRRIPIERAHDHIAGLTLMNEGSIRDWLRHAKFNVTQGKNFEKSGSLGPGLVPACSIANYDRLAIQTVVNGELRQNDNTENLMFPFRYLVHYLSIFYRLKPGDIIATGTPIGAGARFDPPRYLVPGDTVTITCPDIGTLVNGIIDEDV